MDKLDELIQKGQSFNFRNNSQTNQHGTFSKASDELLGWAASVEDFIQNNYGEESAAYKLFLSFERTKLTGYYQSDFDKQMTILNGALKACKNISPKSTQKQVDDHQVIRLIKNPYFWTVLLVVTGTAFGLGLHFGSSKFDKEKSDFYEQTLILNNEVIEQQKSSAAKDSIIREFKTKITLLEDSLASKK